jgi:DNA-binding NarL/FixJ family response regulator
VSGKSKIRILIAEDQALIREGLSTLLGQQNDDFEIVASASDGQQAIEHTRRYRPDVVLMDVHMPRLDGIAATRQILREFPTTKIIMLTMFEMNETIFDAISAGARAYLLKDTQIDDAAKTIRAVAGGYAQLSPSVAARILDDFKRLRLVRLPVSRTFNDVLTARENEFLELIIEGKSHSEIGQQLHLSEGTVKNYVSAILSKCQVKNRTELAIMQSVEGTRQKPLSRNARSA